MKSREVNNKVDIKNVETSSTDGAVWANFFILDKIWAVLEKFAGLFIPIYPYFTTENGWILQLELIPGASNNFIWKLSLKHL
jgi:hypothetical protein